MTNTPEVVLREKNIEATLLSLAWHDEALADHILAEAEEDWFVDRAVRAAYGVLVRCRDKSRIERTLELRKVEDSLGTEAATFMSHLAENYWCDAREVKDYIQILSQRHRERGVVSALKRVESAIIRQDYDGDSLEGLTLKEVTKALRMDAFSGLTPLGTAMLEEVAAMEARQGTSVSAGIPCGLASVNYRVNGLQRGDLVLIGARPSMGKTQFLLDIAQHIARASGPVLLASLEMNRNRIASRLGQGLGQMTSAEYYGEVTEENLTRLRKAAAITADWPLIILDKRGISASQIGAYARIVAAQQGRLDAIMVDYLTMLRLSGEQRHLAIGDACLELRNLAAELDCPVILASQLNRGVEMRDDKRPKMSDMRESGNIEEYADTVMLLYRDEYYYPELVDERHTRNILEVNVAKCRNGGRPGLSYLYFEDSTQRFRDASRKEVNDIVRPRQGSSIRDKQRDGTGGKTYRDGYTAY